MENFGVLCASLYRGGAERMSLYIAKYAKRCGYNVNLITINRNKVEFDNPVGIDRYILSESIRSQNGNYRNLDYLKYVRQIRKIIKKKHIDTLLIMGVPLGLYGIPACIDLDVKVFISERNDPAHFAGKNITKILARILMRKAHGHIFQTEEAMRFYGKKAAHLSCVLPNPLFDAGFERFDKNIETREKRIVSVGRLDKQKNQKMLIDAFSIFSNDFPEYILEIWGDGPERTFIDSYIDKMKLRSKVYLHGVVDDLFSKIYDAAIFVLSSDFEGMPNALMEAMALGIPCISTDCPCGGPRELIKDGNNGYLVPVGDCKKMSETMKLIVSDEDLSRMISKNAKRIREDYSYEKIGIKWMDFLQQ